MENLRKELHDMFNEMDIDQNAKKAIIQSIVMKIEAPVEISNLQAKLKARYEYEKHYLELIKEYKEEIKFAANIQEDLRKERTKFFSESLKEVSHTLKDSQVDNEIASVWLKELVESYTKSLDLSSGLIEEHTLDMIGEIKKETKNDIAKVNDKK